MVTLVTRHPRDAARTIGVDADDSDHTRDESSQSGTFGPRDRTMTPPVPGQPAATRPSYSAGYTKGTRWRWWHPAFWIGVIAQAVLIGLIAVQTDRWAEVQVDRYVDLDHTSLWATPALLLGVLGAVVAGVWAVGGPRSVPFALFRAALHLLVLSGLGMVGLIAGSVLEENVTRVGDMVLYAILATMLVSPVLALTLWVIAHTVDVRRQLGRVLSRWDLASIPGVFVGFAAFCTFGILVGLGPGDEDAGRRGGLVLIVLSMLGLRPSPRPEFLVAAWLGLALLVTCIVWSRRLSKRMPGL